MADELPTPTKRKRGEAKLAWLSKLTQGLKLEFETRCGTPVKTNSEKVTVYVGKLAKDGRNFPLDEHEWLNIKDLDEKIKEAKSSVEDIFVFPEECNTWFENTLHDSWRQNKHRKKLKYFNPYNCHKDWYANFPPNVIESQWSNLIAYWQTKAYKDMCERNKKNRSKLEVPHVAGSKSYMNHGCEIEKFTNKPASRTEIYLKTHRRSKVGIVNETATKNIDRMEELKRKASEDGMQSQESLSQLDGNIYSQVMCVDKRGKIRGVGKGVERKRVRGESSTARSNDGELRKLREEVQMLRTNRDEMRKDRDKLQSEMRKMMQIVSTLASQQDLSPPLDSPLSFSSTQE